jgi:hypothetical protein
MKLYRAFYLDCQACPFKASCVPKADYKQLVRSAFDDAYRRAWHRQRSPHAQHMRRVRQRTVEPMFGSLLQYYGLRRVGTKGRAAAHKAMLLTAIAYNLKKLLKYPSKQQLGLALALPVPPPPLPSPCFRLRLQRQRVAPKKIKCPARRRPEFCNSHLRR